MNISLKTKDNQKIVVIQKKTMAIIFTIFAILSLLYAVNAWFFTKPYDSAEHSDFENTMMPAYYRNQNLQASRYISLFFFAILTILATLSHMTKVTIIKDKRQIKIYTTKSMKNPEIINLKDKPEIGAKKSSTIDLTGYNYESLWIKTKNKKAYLESKSIFFSYKGRNQRLFTVNDLKNISEHLNIPIGEGIQEGGSIFISGINIYKGKDKKIDTNEDIKGRKI